MSISSIMEKMFLTGYAASELTVGTIFFCLGLTAVIALYICVVYRMTNRNAFYDRSFRLSLFSLAVITAAVILTIQSNVIVSLGMVGALSIVRFRTAIKSPMDLVFLFWSIAAGIICGAGFALIAVIGSLLLTLGIVVFSILPAERETLILVVNSASYNEEAVMGAVTGACRRWKIRARNVADGHVSLAVEVKTDDAHALVQAVSAVEDVTGVSLVEHDGDVTL